MPFLTRRTVLCGLSGLAGVAALPAGRGHAGAQPFSAIDQMLDGYVREKRGRGVVAIARHRRLVHVAGFGTAPDLRFQIFSLSKMVTGLAVATLVQQGKLGLDDPVARWLGRAWTQPADVRLTSITVGQVLSHTAGLASSRDDDEIVRRVRRSGRGADRERNRGDLVALLVKEPLAQAPGQSYLYSNLGYAVLGSVIEAASGEAYEEYCRRKVLQPLGLSKPGIDPSTRYGDSYLGWRMTAPELLRLLEAYEADDPRVLTPEMHRFLRTPSGGWVNEQRGTYYSLGVSVRRAGSGTFAWWASGYGGGGSGPDKDLSAMASRSTRGESVSWMVTPNLSRDGYNEFDRRVWDAVRDTKSWPEHDLYGKYGV